MRRRLLVALLSAASISLVASGWANAADPASAAQAGQAPLVINGQLTYRERVALPPSAVVVVELRDASTADGPVIAEDRIELKGRQVPVPFDLTVDRAKLVPGRKYTVRGAIFDGGRATWVSEPVGVDVSASRVDLGTLAMQPYRAVAFATTWQCGPQTAVFGVYGDKADLTVANSSFAMRPVVTASGSKFEALSDPTTSLWEKGNTATLVVKGREYPECVKAGAASPFRATGNEPGWRLDIADGSITLLTDMGQTRTVMAAPAPEVTGGTRKYIARDGGRSLTVTISDQVCVDNMSGMPHPNKVVVVLDGKEMNGCGGQPAALLQGEWVVESIAGASLVKESKVTMTFADGQLSGSSSCNRFTGGYTLTGEALSITQPAGTRMACIPDELMKQEAAFLKLLTLVTTFSVEGNTLTLSTADGRAIKARRAPATLQGAEWMVESINGQPVIAGSKAMLNFGTDGRLSGNSSCNNVIGGFTVKGQALSIPKPAGTMMACEPEVMKQEAAVLAILPDITQYAIEGDQLTLSTKDGRAIKARRK